MLAATQTPTDKEWFQGTADAVRQYAWLFEDIKNRVIQDIVILSGDHLWAFYLIILILLISSSLAYLSKIIINASQAIVILKGVHLAVRWFSTYAMCTYHAFD